MLLDLCSFFWMRVSNVLTVKTQIFFHSMETTKDTIFTLARNEDSILTFGGLWSKYNISLQVRTNAVWLYPRECFSLELKMTGSLKYGLSFNTRPWMETNTCSMVEFDLPHFSDPEPNQVFSRLRQTLPLSYKFGLSRSPLEWKWTFCAHWIGFC